MPEPVSAVAGFLAGGYTLLQALARTNSGVSTAARDVQMNASDVSDSAERSFALFGKKTAALTALQALRRDCGQAGWDGQDAEPVNPAALATAAHFVRLLPDDLPLPEFAPEPDGSISVDWIQSRHRLFSVSIGSSNRLAYAWLDGSDKGHGVTQFDGGSVPVRVLDGIEAILNHGDASLRAA